MRKTIQATRSVLKNIMVEETCDWCGAAMYKDGGYTDSALHMSIVDNEDFDFEYRVTCGEGTHMIGSGWRIDDICHDCIPRLRKLLEDSGIQLEEIDF